MNMSNHHNDERPPPEGGVSPVGAFFRAFSRWRKTVIRITGKNDTYHWGQSYVWFDQIIRIIGANHTYDSIRAYGWLLQTILL